MLRKLRFQLILLSLVGAIGLVALLGGGSYYLLQRYMQQSTDLALKMKMALQFRQYGLPLPPELASAERNWLGNQNQPPASTNTAVPISLDQQNRGTDTAQAAGEENESDEHSSDQGSSPQKESESASSGSYSSEESYDDELKSVFVIPLDPSGQVLQSANQLLPAAVQDKQASASALANGVDLRTAQLENGSRARLLTYRVALQGGPELLQVGRSLNEQALILRQFLIGLVVLGVIAAILLGLGSWYLTGRALIPAQRAWENQQIFIANASHELRAPLTLVKANAEVGLRASPPPEQQEILSEILSETDYMNRMVDDLLLLSRLDTQRLKLDRKPVPVNDLFEEVQYQVRLLAAEKAITVSLGETTGVINGDPLRLRQILLILLDNALRYTPPGGQIDLESRLSGKLVEIQVMDNGEGIPANDLPHVFDRFYQVQHSGEDEQRGNGLGLSIAKALVEAQGGEISIASQPGHGTRISIKFPASG
jgi:signal transduction histidine kinase